MKVPQLENGWACVVLSECLYRWSPLLCWHTNLDDVDTGQHVQV